VVGDGTVAACTRPLRAGDGGSFGPEQRERGGADASRLERQHAAFVAPRETVPAAGRLAPQGAAAVSFRGGAAGGGVANLSLDALRARRNARRRGAAGERNLVRRSPPPARGAVEHGVGERVAPRTRSARGIVRVEGRTAGGVRRARPAVQSDMTTPSKPPLAPYSGSERQRALGSSCGPL